MSEPAAASLTWRQRVGLYLALVGLTALGYGGNLHDFFLADDFSGLYIASRVETVGEALDLRGNFRLQLVREMQPDTELPPGILRPFSTLTFWLNYFTSGLEPWGFHGFTFAVHAGNGVLVAELALALGGGLLGAAVAGAAFTVFPLHPEAVTWLAARADVLVASFMLLTLLGWLRWLRGGPRRTLVWTCAGFTLAMFSKEAAMTVPLLAAALALPALRTPGGPRRIVTGLGALALAAAIYLSLRLWLIGGLGGYVQSHSLGNALRFVGGALRSVVLPGDQVGWPEPDALRLAGGLAWGSLLACGLLGARRRWLPWLAPLALCYLLSLGTVATWAAIQPNTEGSRLLYPGLAFTATLVGLWSHAARGRVGRAVMLAAVAVLLGSHLAQLRRINDVWHRAADESRLLVHSLRDAAGDRPYLILTNEMPERLRFAYLAQNAFPPAVWAFLGPKRDVRFLTRTEWDAAAQQLPDQVALHGDVFAVLRWDSDRRAWIGPDG